MLSLLALVLASMNYIEWGRAIIPLLPVRNQLQSIGKGDSFGGVSGRVLGWTCQKIWVIIALSYKLLVSALWRPRYRSLRRSCSFSGSLVEEWCPSWATHRVWWSLLAKYSTAWSHYSLSELWWRRHLSLCSPGRSCWLCPEDLLCVEDPSRVPFAPRRILAFSLPHRHT